MVNWFFRILSSVTFLSAVIFTIPLAFDVGGRDCGLAFSLSLALFYVVYSTMRLVTPSSSRYRSAIVNIAAVVQWIAIPSLMIWCLNQFSVDAKALKSPSWVEKTLIWTRSDNQSLSEWLFAPDGMIPSLLIRGWDKFLTFSGPVFQLVEGFCSLLVIQAAGQITRWLVNRDGGDGWMIGLLALSASVISSAVYFLYRITTFPQIDNVDAILIGAAITCAIFLSAWGIGSGRGNPVESSLLFAYVTLCIYQIFTDYRSTSAAAELSSTPLQPEFPPLPPIIMASYTTITQIFSNLPSAILSTFQFLTGAIMTITPSVIISLAYRVFVLYASTRIIPAVRESGARALSQAPSLEDNDGVGQIVGLISWFSPSILISVYTGLLMQHFASSTGGTVENASWWTNQGSNSGGNLWRWLNLGLTMLLYAVELYMGMGDSDNLTSHWKVD